MIFYSKEPSLRVLITEQKYCLFKQHFYETDDADEIQILSNAKGIKAVQEPEKSAHSVKPEILQSEIEGKNIIRKKSVKTLKPLNSRNQQSKKRKRKSK